MFGKLIVKRIFVLILSNLDCDGGPPLIIYEQVQAQLSSTLGTKF